MKARNDIVRHIYPPTVDVYKSCLFLPGLQPFMPIFLIVLYRKLIVPQKEPSPLLDRKIEELEAKFADMTDEELEDLGDDDGELGDQSLPQMQSSMSSDMDIMPYTPPQVRVHIFH